MGTIIVGDDQLVSLALRGPRHAKVAAILLRTQVVTARRTGHIICYADERVWRGIVQAAAYGKVAAAIARCMRCGQHAWLSAWVSASKEEAALAPSLHARCVQSRGGDMCAYLLACRGDESLKELGVSVGIFARRAVSDG